MRFGDGLSLKWIVCVNRGEGIDINSVDKEKDLEIWCTQDLKPSFQ